MVWFKRHKNGSSEPSTGSDIVTALQPVIDQNGVITPPKNPKLKEKFLRSLRAYELDEQSSNNVLATIDAILEIEPSSAAWILKTLTDKKVKGTLILDAFNELEQRIKTVSDTSEDTSPVLRSTLHNSTDDDTGIKEDAVSDEDTLVDPELLENDEAKLINTLAEPSSEPSTVVFTPMELAQQHVVKAEGDTLNDRYEITECIGSGVMSRVYKAVDRNKLEADDPNPTVAIKIFNQKISFNEDWLHVLQREAEKCQGLFHPNIVEVFDFGHDGSTVYMVMEYLTGQSLGTKIQNLGFKAMAPNEAQHIINEIGSALSFAHLHGVVHCDLKPANVIVNYLGEVKVINFALAQALQYVEEPLADAQFQGTNTPIYASPEMLEHKELDPRDDIFSLACTAYQLITGRHPFNRMRATEARDIGVRVRRPKKLPEPQWIALRDALCFERDKRTSTIAGFLETFNSRALPRHSIIAVSAGVVALAVIGFLVANKYFISGSEDFDESLLAPAPSVHTEAKPVQQSAQHQPVSEASRLTTERLSEAMSPAPLNPVTQAQALKSPTAPEPPSERLQPERQLRAEQSDEVRLQSTEGADPGFGAEEHKPKSASQAVSQQKAMGEVSSSFATAPLDPDLNPQQGYDQTARSKQNPIDTEITSTVQRLQAHSAAVTHAEETENTNNVTEFSSIASVTQTDPGRDEIDPRDSSMVQEPNETLDAVFGDRRDTLEEQAQKSLVHGEQVLFRSAQRGDVQKIESLTQSGVPLNTRDRRSGATAIIIASRHGHTAVVKALLDAGADARVRDNQNMTALLWATEGGHSDVVDLLSHSVVDKEVRNAAGETALTAAAWYGYDDIVTSLLANGADVDARNNDGWSALINASINGHVTTARELLVAGANPNLTSNDGKTALMAAAWNGHTAIVKLLCANKSIVNKANADGWTALMNAAWNGHREIVKVLVENGADVRLVNATDQTAAVLAASQGHRDIARLLKHAR